MQRQSLGSPSSKLQINGGKEERQEQEEEKRKLVVVVEEEDKRAEKLLLMRSTSRIEKSIHLIPLLTIFCLLVLYLFSYDPSQKDMENAGFPVGYFHSKDPTEVGRLGRLLEMKNSKSWAILGRRSLKEARNGGATIFLPYSDLYRKLG